MHRETRGLQYHFLNIEWKHMREPYQTDSDVHILNTISESSESVWSHTHWQ